MKPQLRSCQTQNFDMLPLVNEGIPYRLGTAGRLFDAETAEARPHRWLYGPVFVCIYQYYRYYIYNM